MEEKIKEMFNEFLSEELHYEIDNLEESLFYDGKNFNVSGFEETMRDRFIDMVSNAICSR